MAWRARAALIAAALWALPAAAAEIAVDVESGAVLLETEADAPRRPASLTKLMTAFVAFEALAAGEITEETQVTVSKFAAARPPVKLRLRAGTQIAFTDVLGAALVGSKNDAATVVAEAVADSQTAFVARMNDAAARLGMTNTRFVNPTGLPESGQQTTARDMALLSRALLMRFPTRSQLFARRSITALGKRVSTTNPLFGRVKGAEGLKTGFTCAAGYSIAGLVERGDRRVLAVTLGHRNKAARLSAARRLIDGAFEGAGTGAALRSAATVTQTPPDIGACAGAPARLLATDISPEEQALYAAELAKARARLTAATAPASLPAPTTPRPTAPPPLSGWGVFLGAFPDEQRARQQLGVLARAPGTARTERRARDGRVLAFRDGLDRQTATALCKAITSYCIVLTPARLQNRRARWRR